MKKISFCLLLAVFLASSCATHGPFYVGIPYGAAVPYGEGRHPGIDFDKLTYGSSITLNWKCIRTKCDHHKWKASVKNRTGYAKQCEPNKITCPYCSNKSTCPCSSFATKYPKVFECFDKEANPGIDPYTISCSSHMKVNWKCPISKCNCHNWNAPVNTVTTAFKLNMNKIENLVIKTNKKYQDTKSKTFLKIKIAKIKFKDFLR